MGEVRRPIRLGWRGSLFRVGFALGAGWGLLLAFPEVLPDGGHSPVAGWLIVAAFAGAGIALTVGLCAIRPGLLRVPEEAGLWATLGRWLMSGVVSVALIGVVSGVGESVIVRLTGDPRNPQNGLSVVMAMIWYPVMLGPVVATLGAWGWSVHRCRRGLACRGACGGASGAGRGDVEVERELVRAFPGRMREAAIRELERYGDGPHEKEPLRVRLAIIRLSRGSIDEVRQLVDAAKQDYRDVLMWAEEAGAG